MSPEPFAITQTGATVAAAGTFQTLLASNANRKGGLIQNTGTAALQIVFGSGTAVAAAAFSLGAGGTVDLSLGVLLGVYQGEVQVTGALAAPVVTIEATRF